MPKKFVGLFFIFIYLFSSLYPHAGEVKAAISACTASVSPASVSINGSPNLTFTVTNSDSSNLIRWIRVTSPTNNFTITDGSVAGWTDTVDSSSQITFTGATVGPSANIDLAVSVTTGSSTQSSQAWSVAVSDSSTGSNSTICSGSPEVAITEAADETGPVISSLSISDVSQTSVKITWTTDEAATSVVYYGVTSSYGSTKSDSSLVTSHSVEISDLNVNTTYHYNVSSSDSLGNDSESGDNTFVSSKAATTSTTTVTNTETKTEIKIVKDTTLPTVALRTDFTKIYSQAPEILGLAADNIGVTSVEYSTDDGKNWLPVDKLPSIGAKSITFSFIPLGLEDDTYKIKARVTDPSGNRTVSRTYSLTIDRLPPQVGAVVFSVGPQILTIDQQGLVIALVGADIKITLSAVGGPTEIHIRSADLDFPLSKNLASGLWQGTLNFPNTGTFTLTAYAVDGAERNTHRNIGTLTVLESGKVMTEKPADVRATIRVWVKDPTTNIFSLWNGSPYDIQNPQLTSTQGHYSFILPNGTYYLEASSPGYDTLKTAQFTLIRSTPIVLDLQLTKSTTLMFGSITLPWPNILQWLYPKRVKLDLSAFTTIAGKSSTLLGSSVPYFIVESETKAITSLDLRGKPTVLTFLASWLPETAEQLSLLDRFAQEDSINVVPILVQSPPTTAALLRSRGSYALPLYTDHDGVLIEPLSLTQLPAHLFLSRRGVVQVVKTGVLTGEEIVSNMVR